MNRGVSDLAELLRSLQPVLHDGVYAYCTVPRDRQPASVAAVVTVREPEGTTLVVAERDAQEAGLAVLFRAAWITLNVHSDLHAIGLTAAFSTALGRAGISCNVVAGAYHDHIFVPVEFAARAMQALRALQEDPNAHARLLA
jgi:hypothetical protein